MRKKIVAAISLMIALSLPAKSLAADTKPCGLTQYASLDLLEGMYGRLLVPVTLQGAAGFMVLDTAVAISTVSEGTVTRLGLQIKQMPYGADLRFGKTPIRKLAVAKGFAVGGAQFNTAKFVIMPADVEGPGLGDPKMFGYLGMDFFERIDVELDLANRKLNLFSQDHCPGHVVYWSKTFDSAPIRFGGLGELYFPMELDGKKIEATLDTLSQGTALSTDVTKALFDFDSHSSGIETVPTTNGGTLAHYRAMKLSGEGFQISNAQIFLFDRPKNFYCRIGRRAGAAAYDECSGPHPLSLGTNVLKRLRLYIATKEKVLYFTLSSAADQH